MRVLGFMTGTSLDAVDMAVLETEGEAISAFGSAVKIRPWNIFARASRAAAYMNEGKLAEAQADLDAAKKIAPRHSLINYSQAFLLYRQSKFREAQFAIQESQRVAPDFAPGLLLSGAINYANGSYGQAEAELNRFLQTQPNNIIDRANPSLPV